MADKINMEIDIKPVTDMLKRLGYRVGSLSKAQSQGMKLVGDYVVKSVRQNFKESGRPVKWIKSKKPTGKTLIDAGMRGGLMASVHYAVSPGMVTIGPDERPYAAIHQFGGTIKAKTQKYLKFQIPGTNKWVSKKEVKIPARPYLLLQPEDPQKIMKILEYELLNEAIK